MVMNMKRTRLMTSLILASLLLCACGNDTVSTQENQTSQPDVTVGEEAVEENVYPVELQDFGGYEFTFLNQEDDFWTGANHILDYDAETGESIEDAIYLRNRAAEEKLNFKIKVEKSDITTMRSTLNQVVSAGEDVYDVVYLPLYHGGSTFGSEYVTNLKTVDTLQLDQPWWNQSFIETATLQDDVLYTTIDYVNLMGYSYANILCFNKDMMRNLGFDTSPYDLVRSGEWTYDTMLSYMKDAVSMGSQSDFTADLNGDAVYGFACQHEEGPLMLTQGSGSYLVTVDENRIPVLEEDLTRLSNVCDKLSSMLSQPGYCVMVNVDGHQGIDYFLNGRALFYHASLGQCGSARFRSMEQEFGILPAPKYDASQDRYYTNLSQYTFGMNIPTTAQDPNRTGSIMDYLAYLSYYDVIPVLQESLCYKGMRDDDSIEMMKLILETEVVDLTTASGIANEQMTNICKNIVQGKLQFASYMEKQTKKITANIEKLFGES